MSSVRGTDLDTDVIVTGAGPVGLMLSGELRLGGAEVVLLEQLAAPTGESRASQLNARSIEVLDQRGLLDRFGSTQHVDAGHFGGIPLNVGDVASHHPGFSKIPQFHTEAVLAEWGQELGVDLRREHQLRGIETCQGTGNLRVEVATPDGIEHLRASYVVGCDGVDSTVRRLAGIDFPGEGARRELLRADVSGIEVPDRRFERHEHGLAIVSRRPDGVTRVMVHEFGREAVRRDRPPEFGEVVAAWARVTGEDIGGGTPIWVDSFDDASRQAAVYRRGRVLLAGDAAHVQMPAGGQALNLGLQDAANLGWKLAATVRGHAPEWLLDSYHDERHPAGARVLTNVRAQTMLLLGGPEVNALREVLAEILDLPDARAELARQLSGLDIRYAHAPEEHPLTGTRIPHVRLAFRHERSTDTTSLLRSARGFLLDFAADTACEGWADRVDHVPAEPTADGVFAGLDAVLVRPDGHLAWVRAPGTGARLEDALRRWFGEPATSRREPAAHSLAG